MRSIRRARRPLVALVALVAALAIGYGIKAATGHPGHRHPSPTSSTSPARIPMSPSASPSVTTTHTG